MHWQYTRIQELDRENAPYKCQLLVVVAVGEVLISVLFVLVAVVLLHTFACFHVSLFLVSAFQRQFLHIIFNHNKVAQCVIRGKLIFNFDNNDELCFANYLSGYAFTLWTQTVEKNVAFFFQL